MKISIIGTGYVGLVTGVCLSDFNTVYCIDNDKAKINMLNKGTIPIYEPGLNHIMQKNVKNKRLFFTSDLSSTIQKTDILIIAVGTPQNEKGAADLSNVFKVIKIIAESINNYKLIVIKSTVPVGTCKKIESIIRKSADKNAQFDVISNPEFLREGKAIKDFQNPDRIIVGINNMGQSSKAKKIMEIIYKPFLKAKNNIYFMDTNSSELTK
ncbi:MAG: nucleotide sugar dehydrogenase, partial [Candidatus Micrarchaeaceae archaeon]